MGGFSSRKDNYHGESATYLGESRLTKASIRKQVLGTRIAEEQISPLRRTGAACVPFQKLAFGGAELDVGHFVLDEVPNLDRGRADC